MPGFCFGYISIQIKLAILHAVWLPTVSSRPGTVDDRWRKWMCAAAVSFSCFLDSVVLITNAHVSKSDTFWSWFLFNTRVPDISQHVQRGHVNRQRPHWQLCCFEVVEFPFAQSLWCLRLAWGTQFDMTHLMCFLNQVMSIYHISIKFSCWSWTCLW